MGRIGIDATSVAADGKGISRVQLEAVRQLAALGLPHELVAFTRTAEAAALVQAAGARAVPALHPVSIAWEQLGIPLAARRERLDVLLATTDRLPVLPACPVVTWLYEVPTHRMEQNRLHGAGAYQRLADGLTRLLWRRSVRVAAVVCAGSHATARELAGEVPGASGKLKVVHPGLDPSFSPGPGPAGRGRYALHIATSDPRDNTETALQAYALARPRLAQPLPLLLPGGVGRREGAVRAEIARLGLEGDVELLGRVSDAELVELYRGAAAYIDPTLFEGFGYQVLEAMACGAPVIASGTTSIPEIAEGAGLLCDPASPAAFADALVRVLEEPGLAEGMRERGLARAQEFTWERAAQALAGALEEAMAA